MYGIQFRLQFFPRYWLFAIRKRRLCSRYVPSILPRLQRDPAGVNRTRVAQPRVFGVPFSIRILPFPAGSLIK